MADDLAANDDDGRHGGKRMHGGYRGQEEERDHLKTPMAMAAGGATQSTRPMIPRMELKARASGSACGVLARKPDR